MNAIDDLTDDLDLNGLLSELIDECFAVRFEPSQSGDPAASCAILADLLEENGWINLPTVLRSPTCDHEGWMLDILTAGLSQSDAWAADWLCDSS